MRLLAFFVFVVMFSTSSVRADDAPLIQIIRDDGSVSKYKIPEDAVNAPVSIEIKPKVRPVLSLEEEKQQSKLNPVYKQKMQEPEVVPVREVKEKKEAPVVKKAVVKKVKNKAKWIGPPLPARKPLLQPKVMKTVRDLPEGRAIPENMAVSIAIKNAPPAKDFKVFRQMHHGKPVYAVVFKSAEGEVTVLVDAKSGKVFSNK